MEIDDLDRFGLRHMTVAPGMRRMEVIDEIGELLRPGQAPDFDRNKVRLLGVATPEPVRQLSDVSTIRSTFADFSLASWNGSLAPAKTPSEIIDTLAQHVIAAAKDPGNVAQLTALGIETNGPTPEQFGAVTEREQPQFDEAANLQPQ